ncbi:hypothetical protein [Aquitalea pelogenes]|uniref:hypothetical protein n=1 Tax=Aquitalea pelogenes TaxID=1293573 RepID=UPI00128F1AD4|nr:hypothetical protein [Aquitalea pelogenes]
MKWKIIFTLLVVIFFSLWYAFDSLEGYCISDRRRYSDDELINLAIANLLMSYPQPASGYDDYKESFRGEGVAQNYDNYINPKDVIYYDGVRDFIDKNKGCCSVVKRRNVDEGELEYWKSIFGEGWRFVRIVYRLKYRIDGRVESPLVVWMGPVDSCGNPTLSTSQTFLR